VILDTSHGLVVIDSGRHPAHAARILDRARKVGKPIIAVINTHWHLDHTTGNREILAAFPSARIVASGAAAGALQGFLARSAELTRKQLADPATDEQARQRLTRALAIMGDRAALVPARPVAGDGPIRIGGRRIELRLASNAATEGDLWLLLPDEQLAIVGDLVVGPFPFFDTGCEEGWTTALDAIERASWTTLIPGHGAPMDRVDFGRWQQAFAAVLDCAHSSRSAADCAAAWERDAAGFFTEVERPSVRELAVYYVDEVLRAPPEKRMAYCRAR
jgi:glyoxylase-like metal-dependent hydrolase (beta-lactamase superfamily II)